MKILSASFSLCLAMVLSLGCQARSTSDFSMEPSAAIALPTDEVENPFYCNDTPSSAFSCPLLQAQTAEDLAQIESLVASFTQQRGDQAGLPTRQDEYQSVPENASAISPTQLPDAYELYLRQIHRVDWWNSPQGTDSLTPNLRSSNYVRPRFLAYVVSGFVAAEEAGAGEREILLAIARSAADYLVESQQTANQGLFPFPDLQAWGIPYAHSETFREIATRLGKLDEVLVDGWYIGDLGEGGLQLDNGLAGVALLELYEATGEEKYLTSALQAADWAIETAIVPNWNYNSVSVHLLARAYGVTGDTRYLESAKKKAKIGVLPGQLQTGVHKGFWADPHNARLNYHYVLIRGIGALVAVMPPEDPNFPQVQAALASAVEAGNQRVLENGVVYPELLLETLSELALDFPPGSEKLDDLGRAQALDLIGRYATEKVLGQGRPISPSAWGLYLKASAAEG